LQAKVATVGCQSYDPQRVMAAVEQALELIGGLGPVVKKDTRVLIKPNLLAAKGPEEAVTTHPEVVAAVAEAVIKAGGDAVIGDSPGGMKLELEGLWEATGMREVSRRTGVPLVNIEAGGSYKKQRNGRTYYISKVALDADLIVNVAKLKTHSLVLFTGAVKNLYGLLPGFCKKETHLIHPKPGPFSEALVDIFSFIMPQINIIDGIQGMDGDGPAAGRTRQLGMLLASRDAVAVDAVAGRLVGIDPGEISTCRLAADQGLGVSSGDEIEVVGDDLRELATEKFVRPGSQLTNLIPTPLVHLLKRFIYTRPQVLSEVCTNCNTCVKACPTEALIPGREHPEFRSRKCIGCLCCHELCPESAIKLRWSLMARFVP
jgi:uncharacterized protein (DUF362 family)/Pyruvate/2-oxoacid:ferredoxin oxidoreductase delta subunit